MIVLAVHIYVVTRPGVSAGSRGMARIDLHQLINQADANRITSWLYRQRGVDHVLVSARSGIAVFTYSPLAADVGRIASGFKDSLSYPRAIRYLPSAGEMQRSCPLRATPVTNSIYQFLKRIF